MRLASAKGWENPAWSSSLWYFSDKKKLKSSKKFAGLGSALWYHDINLKCEQKITPPTSNSIRNPVTASNSYPKSKMPGASATTTRAAGRSKTFPHWRTSTDIYLRTASLSLCPSPALFSSLWLLRLVPLAAGPPSRLTLYWVICLTDFWRHSLIPGKTAQIGCRNTRITSCRIVKLRLWPWKTMSNKRTNKYKSFLEKKNIIFR